jgi:hypothetical protein
VHTGHRRRRSAHVDGAVGEHARGRMRGGRARAAAVWWLLVACGNLEHRDAAAPAAAPAAHFAAAEPSLKPRKPRVFSTSWSTSSARPITQAAQQR